MAVIIPSAWVSTQAYAVGTQVAYNGVGYQCVTAVSANSGGNAIPPGNSAWEVYAVFRITDYYSLQEAIEFALNTNDAEVNNSIPLFIQNTERKVGKLLRSPAQLISRIFTVDADSKFAIPTDMLQVHHLRRNLDTGAGFDILSRGAISIQRGERTSFEELKQYYAGTTYSYDLGAYDFPLFRSDDQYIWIAPEYEAGETFEMMYYQEVPELGSTVGLVNADYVAVNDSDETLAQWVARGGSASTFVQATQLVTSNLWTATIPHLLKAGACREAEQYLNNPERAEHWNNQFIELMTATETEFRKYDAGGSQHITQSTAY